MKNETERIDEYIALFHAIRDRVGDDDIALVILGQVGKHMRMDVLSRRERSAVNGGSDSPATPKQLAYLRTLQIEVPAGCTKQQASELIDSAVGA